MYRLRKTFLIIFLFLILPLVAGQVPDSAWYDRPGGQFDTWERGVSFWNHLTSETCGLLIDCSAAVLQDRQFIPLVENLNPAPSLPSGIVAYFRFDNQSPENATFFVEEISGFNGNCSGVVCPIHTAGFNNTGLLFDGVNDYVQVETAGPLENNTICNDGCSVCTWFKPDTSKKHDLLSRWDGAGEDRFWRLNVENTNIPGFSIGDGEGVIKTAFSLEALPLNQFSFLCGVYTGGNETAGSPEIYVNGELEGTAGTIQINSTAWADSTEDVYIGKITDAGTNFASGVIDEVRAWPRALNGFEIECLYGGECEDLNEIIQFDGQNIELYHGPPLSPVDALDVGFPIMYGTVANLVAGDGRNDIVVTGQTGNVPHVRIIQYTGDGFETIFNTTAVLDYLSGTNFGIRCIDSYGVCLLVFNRRDVHDGGDGGSVNAATFGPSGFISENIALFSGSAGNTPACLPHIVSLPLGDHDNDGTLDIAVTAIRNNKMEVIFVEINETGHIEESHAKGEITTTSASINCFGSADSIRSLASSVVIHDFDGFSGTGTEYAVARRIGGEDFELHIYESDGTLLENYGDADGEIISNLFLLTLFDSAGPSVCVAGYDDDTDQLDVLCGHSIGGEEEIWEYDASGLWDINGSTGYEMAVHSLETVLTQFPAQNEILTGFGVFEFGEQELIGDSDLTLLWSMPKQNGAALSVDVEDIGLEDILLATPTRLWYIDDLFINQEAFITDYTINPCINVPIQVNTSMTVTITVDDDAGEPNDLVQARVFVYYGAANEQGGLWSPLSDHVGGAEFTFPGFVMDEITTNGVIRMEARDDQIPEGLDVVTVPFIVSTTGVEFGECITTVELEPPEPEPEPEPTPVQVNNSVSVVLAQIDEITGLGTTVLWLIIMTFVGGVLWIYGPRFADVSHTVAFVGLIESFLLILGVLLGFLSVAILITVIVLAVIALGVTFRKVFTGA